MDGTKESKRRKATHLRGFDYASPGFYFVTICTHAKHCLIGEIVDAAMRPNALGMLVQACWRAIPNHFPTVDLGQYVVMPNHLHGIICLLEASSQQGAMNRTPTNDRVDPSVGAQFIAPSLGEVVRAFKARCTVALRKEASGVSPIWQRNYYEHVIRSEASLQAIREYISNNPAQWALDQENPVFSGR